MRLLSLNEHGGLAWKEFTQDSIPPYAILSHRWGTEEVSFHDLVNSSGKKKAGYHKVTFCGKQAARDGLRYFWIDTCCIDKWNAREREKAVNSMFNWYKNAKYCYVFLEDVSVNGATNARQQSSWEASFRASEWFTRGWTLQELIAPAIVQFFSKDGQILGDKSILESHILEATKLPAEALQGYSLEDFSTHDRIKWAESRTTTEPEDGAYCLLGILGIQLPLVYGEGKEKAYRRLREELEAKGAPSIIPYSRNDRFVGRESQLAELEAALFNGKQTTRIAISGEGGTGKSQLALELAYRTKHALRSCSVFWIDASNADSLDQSYTRIARKLNIPGSDNEQADIPNLVRMYFSNENAGQWLLIFDNADGIESTNVSTTWTVRLINSLPESALGSIVFTTINHRVVETLTPQSIIELHEVSPDSARVMMEKYLDSQPSPSEQEQMKLLVSELLYFPLAIVHAAAYISTTETSIAEYRDLMIKQRQAAEHARGRSENISSKDSVAMTWLISFGRVRCAHPEATDYLYLVACIHNKDVPVDFLPTTSHSGAEDAVRVLSAYALVTRRPAEAALDIHRLVHQAIREWLTRHELLHRWAEKAVARLETLFPDDDYRNRHKWRRLLPHAQYALSHSLGQMYEVSTGIQKPHQKRKWLSYWVQKQTASLRPSLFPRQYEATLSLAWKCVVALNSDGRYSEAEELQARELRMSSMILSKNHSDTLVSKNYLALTYLKQGRLKEAEKLGMQVMKLRMRILGEKHPDTLTSMDNLTLIYKDQGRLKEAEKLGLQVMKTRMKMLGEKHPDTDTLISMNNLALVYKKQGRWKEAEELEVLVMKTWMRMLGEEHPNTLISMNNLALIYKNQGRWKEAEELEVQVMKTRMRMLGEEHPDTLTSMNNLAMIYNDQGRWNEAEELEMQVMKTWMRVLGEEHPNTLTSVNNLVIIYRNQGRWNEAEELGTRAMEAMVRVLGEEHPDSLTSMNNLAWIMKEQGRIEAAIVLMNKCVQLKTQKLGVDNPDTILSRRALDDWKQKS